jgi:hypothetical protein
MNGRISRGSRGSMVSKKLSFAIIAGAVANAAMIAPASAATALYWDGGNTTIQNPASGGSGTWTTPGTTDWQTSLDNSGAVSAWVSGDDAYFTTKKGTVTLGSSLTLTANNLYFNIAGYNIAGGTASTLSLTGGVITLNNNGSSQYFDSTFGTASTTINAPVVASNGLTVLSPGTGATSSSPAGYGVVAFTNTVKTGTGILTIGNSSGTQAAGVDLTPTAMPTSNIMVNPDSQLLLDSPNSGNQTFGSAGQTITLESYGLAVGNTALNQSGAYRTDGTKTGIGNSLTLLSTISIIGISGGGPNPTLMNGGEVEVSSTKGYYLVHVGNIINGNTDGTIPIFNKQGGGVEEIAGSANVMGTIQIGNGPATPNFTGVTVGSGSSAIAPHTASIYFAPTAGGTFGDLSFAQTTSNTTSVDVGGNITLGSLLMSFSGTTSQQLGLEAGYTLTLNQKTNATFGGISGTQTAKITGGGNLVLSAASTAVLTLTGNTDGTNSSVAGTTNGSATGNDYSGTTYIYGGTLDAANYTTAGNDSATGSSNIIVGDGNAAHHGTLANGLAANHNLGLISGLVTVTKGGYLAPGGDGTVGNMNIGALTLNDGSNVKIDLSSDTSADTISFNTVNTTLGHTLTLNGTDNFVIGGSGYDAGVTGTTLTLMSNVFINQAGLTALTTSHPADGLTYTVLDTLAPGATTGTGNLLLTIQDLSTKLLWDNSQTATTTAAATDGATTHWGTGTNFVQTINGTTSQTTFGAAVTTAAGTGSALSVTFGNANGTAGIVTLDNDILLSGTLKFAPASSGTYTIGANNAHTLTLLGGVSATASATIAAPVLIGLSPIDGAQHTVDVASGKTVTFTGVVGDYNGIPATFTATGSGVASLANAGNTYSGGTSVSNNGTVSITSDGDLGLGGTTVTLNSGTLQTTASMATSRPIALSSSGGTIDTEGTGNTTTLGGTISGALGTLTKIGAGTLAITQTGQTYAGVNIAAGTVQVGSDDSVLGTGGIVLSGGTLQVTNTLNSAKSLSATANTNSFIDTHGNNASFTVPQSGSFNIGAGATITKSGAGTLTLAGSPSATVNLGVLQVSQGDLVIGIQTNHPMSMQASDQPNKYAGNLVIGLPGTGAIRTYISNPTNSTLPAMISGGGNFEFAVSGSTIYTNAGGYPLIISNNTILNSTQPLNAAANGFVGVLGANEGTTSYGNYLSLGAIKGAGTMEFATSATGGGDGQIFINGNSSYTGQTIIATAKGSAAASLTLGTNAGSVFNNVNNALPTNTDLVFGTNGSGSGAYNLNGYNQTVATLQSDPAGGGSVGITNGPSGIDAGNVSNGPGNFGGQNSVLTVNGTSTAAYNFKGHIGYELATNYASASATALDGYIGFNNIALVLGNNFAGTLTLASKGSNWSQAPGGTLTLGDGNDYSSGTTVNAGTLIGGVAQAFGTGPVTVNGGSLLQTAANALTNGFDYGTNAFAQSLAVNGGNVILSQSNSFSGGTIVTAGNLTGGAAGALGTGNVALNGGTFSETAANALSSTNSLTVNGPSVTLGFSNSYSGATLLTTGTLIGGAAGAFGTGSVTVNGGSFSQTVANVLTSTNSLAVNGGNVALGYSNSYTGGTTVTGGTLKLLADGATGTGTVNVSGTGILTGGYTITGNLVVGDAPAGHIQPNPTPATFATDTTLSVTGNTTIGAGAILDFNVSTISDKLAVGGNLFLTGSAGSVTFNLTKDSAYSPIVSPNDLVIPLITYTGAHISDISSLSPNYVGFDPTKTLEKLVSNPTSDEIDLVLSSAITGPLINLSTTAPSNYSATSPGSVAAVTDGHGNYKPNAGVAITETTKGYIQLTNLILNKPVDVMLDIDLGTSGKTMDDVVAALNSADGGPNSADPGLFVVDDHSALLQTAPNSPGDPWDVIVDFTGNTTASSEYFTFDLSSTQLGTGVSVEAITIIPEPTSIGALAIGGLLLLGRRPRRSKK